MMQIQKIFVSLRQIYGKKEIYSLKTLQDGY